MIYKAETSGRCRYILRLSNLYGKLTCYLRVQFNRNFIIAKCLDAVSQYNFLLVKVDDAPQMYEALISNGVIVRDRSRVAGCEGCLRITIGTVEENDKLLEIIEKYEP